MERGRLGAGERIGWKGKAVDRHHGSASVREGNGPKHTCPGLGARDLTTRYDCCDEKKKVRKGGLLESHVRVFDG